MKLLHRFMNVDRLESAKLLHMETYRAGIWFHWYALNVAMHFNFLNDLDF